VKGIASSFCTIIISVIVALGITGPAQSSSPAFETLRGNGTCAGYILSHGSIIPGSDSITVGGSKKVRNRDYTIDYASGTLMFTEPVAQSQSVTASYRYEANEKGERPLVGIPGLPVLDTQNFSMNLTYAYRFGNEADGSASPDFATYGLNTTTKLGANSSLKSMFYMSSPQEKTQTIDHLTPKNTTQPAPKQKPKSDELIVQEGEFNMGSLRLKMGYQNVGENFAGISAMRDTKAAPDTVLAQLDKEKGLKRFDVGAEIDLGRGISLTASSKQIKDKNDDIISNTVGFASNNIKLNVSTSKAGENFNRFKDIKEANRDQLAKEAGMKRTSMGLEFASPGAGKDSPWNKLGFNKITDAGGEISAQSAVLNFGKVGLSYFHRNVDAGFSRLGSLSKDDATQMALEIRQQFDPNATANQVTDEDRRQIMNEAGMDRTRMGLSFDAGSVKTSLQMLEIGNQSGGIERKSISISGENYSLSLMDQTIDESFDKMGMLAPTERAQFGNERGMRRTNAAGTFKTGMGSLALGFSKVTDSSGASVLKQRLGFSNNKINFTANFQNVDESFERAGDLADSDRRQLQQERGFKKTDLSANIKFSDKLGLESFYSTSKHSSTSAAREQLRNNLTYTTGFGARIQMFRDEQSQTDADGRTSSNLRQWVKLDHKLPIFGGLSVMGLHDTNTKTALEGTEATATVDQMYIESDKSKKTWIVGDHKTVSFGNGKKEETQSYNLSSKPAQNLSLTGSFLAIDRGEDGSEEVRTYALQWGINKNLSFKAEAMDKDGSNTDVTARRSYSLTGLIAERFSVFSNLKLSASRSVEDKHGNLFKETNAIRMEANVLKGNFAAEYGSSVDAVGNHPFTRAFSFVSDRDPKNRLKFDISYKTRDFGPGGPIIIRDYNLDYKLSEKTSLSYNYFSYKEKRDNKVDPVGGSIIRFNTMIKQYSFTASFKEESNYATCFDRDIYALGIAGKLNWGALVEVSYSLNDISTPGNRSKDHTYWFKYDHQLDADHFLTFTSELKVADNHVPGTQKEIMTRLDFKTVFH